METTNRPSPLSNGYVPVDMDVTPFDNSKTKKRGQSHIITALFPMMFLSFPALRPVLLWIRQPPPHVRPPFRVGRFRRLQFVNQTDGKEQGFPIFPFFRVIQHIPNNAFHRVSPSGLSACRGGGTVPAVVTFQADSVSRSSLRVPYFARIYIFGD